MRLDERGLAKAETAVVLCASASGSKGIDLLKDLAHSAVIAYVSHLSSAVPGDVRELATELRENADFHRDAYLKLQDPNTGNHLGWTHGEYLAGLIDKATTTLLTLSAEHAELKARLERR